MARTARRAAVLGVLGVLLTGCSSTVTGSGTGGTPTTSRNSSPDFPSGSTAAGSSTGSSTAGTSAPPTVASSTPTYETVTVRGSSSGRSITLRVYARDRIDDCSAHAYGTTMIRFLGAHPCRGATRVLATTAVGGRTVVLSIISTGFAGTTADPYGPAGRFAQLEKADGTGSINDLLREGRAIPGVASRIPANEVFLVLGQDTAVVVFDLWYRSGGTDDNDRTLKKLGYDLFLTSLTAN